MLSAIRTVFTTKKVCVVLGTCTEFVMKEAGNNFTLEISKGWHGIFLSVHEGIWVGIGWRAYTNEDTL